MKVKYSAPIAEVHIFECDDVIVASGATEPTTWGGGHISEGGAEI